MSSSEFSRTRRVGEQLKRELAVLVQRETKDAHMGLVTVSAVDVSPDLHHAKVFVTVLGAEEGKESVVRALNDNAAALRHELARHVRLRFMPHLHFEFDESVERGARMSSLLDDLSRERKEDK